MSEQGDAVELGGQSAGAAHDTRGKRESGEVMIVSTLRAPRNAGSGVQIMAPDPRERETIPIPTPADGDEDVIELPQSRRVSQRPPTESSDESSEDGIIGLPTDVRIDDDAQDADGEILGLPSQLPGSTTTTVEHEEDEGEMVGLPTTSTYPEIPPPPFTEGADADEDDDFDPEGDEFEDTIIYPSKD